MAYPFVAALGFLSMAGVPARFLVNPEVSGFHHDVQDLRFGSIKMVEAQRDRESASAGYKRDVDSTLLHSCLLGIYYREDQCDGYQYNEKCFIITENLIDISISNS